MPVTTPPKLHAIFDITTDTNDGFQIGWAGPSTANITLARGAGEIAGYYIRAHTFGPEAVPAGRTGGVPGTATGDGAQLVEEIQAKVRAVGAPWGAFSCVVSDTGIVTMSDPATAFVIVDRPATTSWTGVNGLRQLLGFTDTTVPATSFIAPNQHRYGWYPNVPPANFPGIVDQPDVPSSPGADVQRAPSGLVTARAYAAAVYDRTYTFNWLDRERAFIELTGSVNMSLEQFWLDALRTGARLRYYEDRTVQTAPGGGAPWGYVAGPRIAEEGPSALRQDVDALDTLWNVEIDLYRFVASP